MIKYQTLQALTISGYKVGVLEKLLTLGFLPKALNMMDGNVTSYTIPIIGVVVEVFLNWIAAIFINLIDFCLWLVNWIPGVRQIIAFVYRAPDAAEHLFPQLFGMSHRNFITHSAINPIFLGFLLVGFILARAFPPLKVFVMLIGLSFVCHLLADTMPQAWQGTALIKVYLFRGFFTLPRFFSKLWLYINVVIALGLVVGAADFREDSRPSATA